LESNSEAHTGDLSKITNLGKQFIEAGVELTMKTPENLTQNIAHGRDPSYLERHADGARLWTMRINWYLVIFWRC
jgi:hypothetical protein